MLSQDEMLRVSDLDDAIARRKDRERAMLEEGEALWRAKQRQQWISRLQDQREVSAYISTYSGIHTAVQVKGNISMVFVISIIRD
jgi:hypothetical protein